MKWFTAGEATPRYHRARAGRGAPVDILQTAIGIIGGAGVVAVVGIVVWNDVVRPRRDIDPGDQRERDQAKHGVYTPHAGDDGGHGDN